MNETHLKTILFDLDGTFADTAPDLADALNRTLQANGRDVLTFETIRPVVSHGGRALIELGFGISPDDPAFEPLRLQLLDFYKNDIAQHTELFPGMVECLQQIRERQMTWGIVTNKPGWLTMPLLETLSLPLPPCSIVSGDTLVQRKPDPAPLLHASQQCTSKPERCLYIGDAERDIVAGKRAGMITMVAMYGYIGVEEDPRHWQADAYISHPLDILPWVDNYNQMQTTTHYAD